MSNEKTARRERLEARGWKVVNVDDFLGLTPEESAIVEMKLNLSASLKSLRGAAQLSQVALAERIHSSQSRVQKAEKGDPGVSLDFLVKGILATGASRADVAAIIAGDPAEIMRASAAKGLADLDDAFDEILHDNEVHADASKQESERALAVAA